MAVNVRIPTPLRKFTGGEDVVSVEGGSVREALDNLVGNYPELKAQIMDDQGEVRRFVNLFLNDQDVRFQGGPEAEIKDGDELSIIPAIAGGR